MARSARPHRTDTIWLHPRRDIKIVGLDTPHKSLTEHSFYDPRINDELKQEDIDNVRDNGVIVNVLVKRDGEFYLLVDGRGRVRKARVVTDEQEAAGIPIEDQLMVPCTRVSGDDATLMLMSRTANSGRSVDSDYRIGEYARVLMSPKYNKSYEQVSIAFGFSAAKIRNCIALLDLAPESIADLDAGVYSATAAVQVATLARDDQVALGEEIKAEAAKGIKPTVERITDKVRDKLGKDESKTPRKRVARATEIITAFADKLADATRADMLATLEKVCKALTDKPLKKIANTGD